MFGDDGEGDDLLPDDEIAPHLHPPRNPWQTDDPEEGDISNFHFTRTGPTRFNVQATITRSVSPQGAQGGMAPGSIGGFMSMLNGLVGTAAQPQGQRPPQGQGDGLFSGPNQNQEQSAFNEANNQGAQGQPQFRTGRFTYHGGARLFPRDANNPQPRVEPVDDIAK